MRAYGVDGHSMALIEHPAVHTYVFIKRSLFVSFIWLASVWNIKHIYKHHS